MIWDRHLKCYSPLLALAFSLPALGYELSVEPAPETGSELFVHLSSTQYGDCWDGPLPFVSAGGISGDALVVLVDGEDYTECHATPLDVQVQLGTIPAGVASVELYGCGGNPPPGAPYCSASPFLTIPVTQAIFSNSFE